MQKPLEFYKSEKTKYELELSSLKKKLALSSTIRLILFIVMALGIYFFFSNLKLVAGIAILGIALFLYLVLRHGKLQYQRDFINQLIALNTTEIDVFYGKYYDLNEGIAYTNPKHFYSYDIDLFGKGSFFQYTNRTVTKEGEREFANQLTQNNIIDIEQRQNGIKELAKIPKWRQEFSAIGSLVNVQHPAKHIIKWIHNYESALPKFMMFLPKVFAAISFILFVLLSFEIITYHFLLLWFFIGLGFAGAYLKRVNSIYEDAGKAKDTFKQYHKLLDKIESTTFSSEILIAQQNAIKTEKEKASVIFKKFSKILDALDQRNNMIMAIIGNGFLLWDAHQAFKIENWINTYKSNVENWFKVIAFFDAQNSLANFAFNHQNYVYPELNGDKNVIKAEQLGHPLLKTTKRVDNDFTIENQQFFIITGANMAGKSTFLRTVSLAIVMANIGLPVCAKSFSYSPIKLITSMRTSDSLADDESYFFSELKRLKFIVEEINPNVSGDNYFIILDEILKGTNSTDKAIGSKKFVQKLVASNSTGIIATHDLSLCEIEKELDAIKNYYFDAEIIDDELHFDYQLKNGVCKNMNASFLLKKMEIV
ncbi:DNA mismatch repair protein MutS [Aureibaculum sp. 2210JD6-5]|uniref:MutS-related protein n=1 Tax=Aureibaculum sp. 2210JD6-5 TaxID=3103957 RepID=UPI002AACDBFE|nr:DNA mismatch repair protein MutS [Aureibaculum sp. 2210JD6-5]MDY7396213.1 DNA mismatch repair protein MutS [Aureibaculum sp. 2210JD6-5]